SIRSVLHSSSNARPLGHHQPARAFYQSTGSSFINQKTKSSQSSNIDQKNSHSPVHAGGSGWKIRQNGFVGSNANSKFNRPWNYEHRKHKGPDAQRGSGILHPVHSKGQ